MPVADAPMETLRAPALLIGGREFTTASGGVHQHVYAATGQPTAEVPLAGPAEIDQAVAAARAALPGWKATTPDRRRDLLLRMAALVDEHAETLTMLNIIDTSTPLLITGAQMGMVSDLLRYNAGWADKIGGQVHPTWPMKALDYSLDEPYGVIGVIIPWNGPITSIAQVLSPALAAGNCVVLKPPELAPFGSLEMGRLFAEAGFPPGVVNVVPGGPQGGAALVGHPGIDKVHFTGSGETGRKVMESCTRTLKPLGLELGGKSAVMVFDDADIGGAIQAAVAAVTVSLSGQACIAGTRVLVQRGIYDAVVEATADAMRAVSVGDPLDLDTVMGPVNNEDHMTRILATVAAATEHKHGRLVTGGERLGGDLAGGFFLSPALFADTDPASPLARDEIFGPVQTITPFDTEAEAVAIANDTDYGLAGYVHTQNIGRAHRVAAKLDAGNIWVNGGFGIPAAAPFGGVKQSGFGRLGGIDGIREFSRPKNIWIAL